MEPEQKFYAVQTGQCLLAFILMCAIIATCADRQDARFPTRTVSTTQVLAGAPGK